MVDGIIAAVVSAVVAGAIGLAGIWYQGRRARQDAEGRLTAARIAETRRYALEFLGWLTVAKNVAGREGAGPVPVGSTYPSEDIGLVGDADVIGRYLDTLAWLTAKPDGGGLDLNVQAGLATLVGELRRALGAQELLAIQGKPIKRVSEADRAKLDQQARVIFQAAAERESAERASRVTIDSLPRDDSEFAAAVRAAIEFDEGDIAEAVHRVGSSLRGRYPGITLELTARPDGTGPRAWRAYREPRLRPVRVPESPTVESR
jgi:hypothetical protein